MTPVTRWLTEINPEAMFTLLEARGVLSRRLVRLFTCGCYRICWAQIRHPELRAAVERAEDFADGTIPSETLMSITVPGGLTRYSTADMRLGPTLTQLRNPRLGSPFPLARLIRQAYPTYDTEDPDECPDQADLLRDIFGNPYRTMPLAAEWRTPAVLALAEGMYAARQFEAMPVLADALEEAGCQHSEILQHARKPALHVRGCWLIDLILRKRESATPGPQHNHA